jgi:hypothetical protein
VRTGATLELRVMYTVLKDHTLKWGLYTSVAEPDPHHLVGAGVVKRCGSGSDASDSDNGIKHSKELENNTKCNSL